MMTTYAIRIAGELDSYWGEWFAGMDICHPNPGETLITGEVRDQSELYGLLAKLRDLGLSLIAVNPLQMPD